MTLFTCKAYWNWIFEFDLPTDATFTSTDWYPAALDSVVHVINVVETLIIVHEIPPTETLVVPLTKLLPVIVNVSPALPDVGLSDVTVGVIVELYANENVFGKLMPFEVIWIVADDAPDPWAGIMHCIWLDVVWMIGHEFKPTVTWTLLVELENPLPLMVRKDPP